MPDATAYNTVETITAILQQELASTDARRLAWEAADESDQAVFALRATEDIDGPLWLGVRAERDQPNEWPRLWRRDLAYVDPDPSPAGDAPVPSIPARVARAHAIQSALRALRARGLDPGRALEDAANRGVVSHSGGGHSESIDLERANSTWSRLDPEAQRLLVRYRAAGVGVL